ncbi:glycosyltransferase family 39 protein [Patescibacteria group bacterium]|nr:glycosyltransferase family 39 protein [Patescibacteria group bacterium]
MKKALVIIFFLILITVPTVLPFFSTKFFYTQDHIFVARLQQMSSALLSGQFPVRWAPDLRYGEPLFNFYAPLPYYLGAIINLSGLDFIWVAKTLFILSSILSAATMYILCRKLFDSKAAFLAAFLYIYAPYRAVDIYVRGALSESFAFIFFPLIFYSSVLLSEKRDLSRICLLALSLAGLFLTHSITTLMFMPFLVFFWIYLIFEKKARRLIFLFLGSLALGSGVSAFFLLPAMVERQFIQTQYLIVGYFDFRAHFVAFFQLFSTYWGYGSSLWGLDDGLSFQIGSVHWVILALALVLGLFLIKNRYKSVANKKSLFFLIFLGVSFFISIFLQHNKSAFIWEAISLMAFIQFPWRFLAISIFFVAIIGGAVASYFQNKYKLIYFILIIAVVVVNLGYFKPKEYVKESFFDKFLNVEIMQKGVDLTKDYLPIWVATTDGDKFDSPRTQSGSAEFSNLKQSSATFEFMADVASDSLIEVPITYFPGWEVRANGQLVNQEKPSEMGLIRFTLPKGNYSIDIEFKNTPIRTVGNTISIFSILTILALVSLRKKYKNA